MFLDPSPIVLFDPAVPMLFEHTLGVLPLGYIMVTLPRFDSIPEGSIGDPSFQDEPRPEIDASLFAVSKYRVRSQGRRRRGGREAHGRLRGRGRGFDLVGEFVKLVKDAHLGEVLQQGLKRMNPRCFQLAICGIQVSVG
jgi:hypothetical protein